MARTSTSRPQVETKALAASTKSEGMRMLYDAGYSVSQVTKVFGCPYGFAYGVALRAGKVETAANRKVAKAKRPVAVKVTKVAGKTTTKPAARSTAKVAAKPDKISATARVAAKIASAKGKPGRPSADRRQANRKPRAGTKA